MAKNRHHRDKRDAKKREERRRRRARQATTPGGALHHRYKSEEYVPIFLATELAVVKADVLRHGGLTDAEVRAAFDDLIQQLLHGPFVPAEPNAAADVSGLGEKELVVELVRREWAALFQEPPDPGADVLVGILRTLLESLDVYALPGQESRGYLVFLHDFLRQAGVYVEGDDEIEDEVAPILDERVMDLIALGQDWEEGSHEARLQFYHLAGDLSTAGEGELVEGAVSALLESSGPGSFTQELKNIAAAARKRIRPVMPFA